jgi:hypothetical protein
MYWTTGLDYSHLPTVLYIIDDGEMVADSFPDELLSLFSAAPEELVLGKGETQIPARADGDDDARGSRPSIIPSTPRYIAVIIYIDLDSRVVLSRRAALVSTVQVVRLGHDPDRRCRDHLRHTDDAGRRGGRCSPVRSP